MCKNNSGFSAKFKVSILVQGSVINWKVRALKSATIFILTVSIHLRKNRYENKNDAKIVIKIIYDLGVLIVFSNTSAEIGFDIKPLISVYFFDLSKSIGSTEEVTI